VGGVDAGFAGKPRARVRRAVCVCKVCKGRGCKGCVRVSTLWIGLRAHKFPPQHSRPAVVVVVEPCAQQRAHAQAHMRAKCPNPHARGRGVVHNRGHRRGDRGASPARGRGVVHNRPIPLARARCRAQQRSPKPARRPRRLTGTRRRSMCACVYARPVFPTAPEPRVARRQRLIDCEKRTREPKRRTASFFSSGTDTHTPQTRDLATKVYDRTQPPWTASKLFHEKERGVA
jgi:hypothetical protein